MSDLFSLLRALELPLGDHVVFGSGPLAVRGVIGPPEDLAVVCRSAALNSLCQLAPAKRVEPWGVELVSLCDGRLTFGTRWAIGDFNSDELIDGAETIDGLPFARLEHVVAYKRLCGRPKDLTHLAALSRFKPES